MPAAVLVPVKSFRAAKRRLAGVLSPDERADLARRMAEHVVAAAAPLPVHVVCDDADVAAWAEGTGSHVVWRPGAGLNGAVSDGVTTLGKLGFDDVVVAHADLPLATDLRRMIRPGLITLVPDRHDDGTNVIAIPTRLGFRFQYGAGSFRRHRAEAGRHGVGVRVWRDPALGVDVDLPRDLRLPAVHDLFRWLATIPASLA